MEIEIGYSFKEEGYRSVSRKRVLMVSQKRVFFFRIGR